MYKLGIEDMHERNATQIRHQIPNHYGVLTFLKFDPCRIRMLLRYRPTQLAFTIFHFFFLKKIT